MPHFCMYSGVSWEPVFCVAPSEGFEGGGGGVAFVGCVCTSSRATAEVERRRRVPLAAGSCRTHLRQALNWRRVGVEAIVLMVSTMFKKDGARWKMW